VFNDKLLSCEIPAGVGKMLSISVTVNSQQSSLSRAFSYVQPVVYVSTPSNAPVTGGISITTLGQYFGFASHMKQRVVTHGSTASDEMAWISDTCVLAKPFGGSSGKLSVQVSVWWQRGFLTSTFSYNAPTAAILTSSRAVLLTGSSIISVLGSSYGSSSVSSRTKLATTTCENSRWMSSSIVLCKANSGSAAGLAIAVSTAMLFSSTPRLLSYSSPEVFTGIASTAIPSSGSVYLSISGDALSSGSFSIANQFGSSSCSVTIWLADSSLVLKVRSGAGMVLTLKTSVSLHSTILHVNKSCSFAVISSCRNWINFYYHNFIRFI
jgi:hypothetical protein